MPQEALLRGKKSFPSQRCLQAPLVSKPASVCSTSGRHCSVNSPQRGVVRRIESGLLWQVKSTNKARSLATAAEGQSFQVLLDELLPLDDADIRAWLPENRDRLSMDFMLWLAERAPRGEQHQLEQLGEKLTALREGLDPQVAAERLASLTDVASLPSSTSAEPAQSLDLELRRRNLDLARRITAHALSPSQAALNELRAAELTRSVREARKNSATELMGRAPVDPRQAERGLNAVAATERILEVLLDLPSREDRVAMLPEAFTPALPDSMQDDEESEQELLHTTPMRMLQAVGVALARLELEEEVDDVTLFLPGSVDRGFRDRASTKKILQELKADIFEQWDAASCR